MQPQKCSTPIVQVTVHSGSASDWELKRNGYEGAGSETALRTTWGRCSLRNGESGEVIYLGAVAPSFKRPREHPEANSTDSAQMNPSRSYPLKTCMKKAGAGIIPHPPSLMNLARKNAA